MNSAKSLVPNDGRLFTGLDVIHYCEEHALQFEAKIKELQGRVIGGETLPLDLNSEQAACLIYLLDAALDTIQEKSKILKEIQDIPFEDRPEELKDDGVIKETLQIQEMLTKDAITFLQEISDILKELDTEKPTQLIIKPNFKV